ncbi:MAG: hypothetical protein IH946_01530 [Bacteroidetes bacterium]|nr:hypothetical protein [Bacteroidota bacterium]
MSHKKTTRSKKEQARVVAKASKLSSASKARRDASFGRGSSSSSSSSSSRAPTKFEQLAKSRGVNLEAEKQRAEKQYRKQYHQLMV